MFQSTESPSHPNVAFTPPAYSRAVGAPVSRDSLQRALALGEQVQRLLDRDPGAGVRSSGSLRGVARQLGLPIPMTTLWRSWAIYRWSCTDPEIAHCRHLRVGHFSVLLGVDSNYRLSLLRVAEHERWSRRKLQARARTLQAAWVQR